MDNKMSEGYRRNVTTIILDRDLTIIKTVR